MASISAASSWNWFNRILSSTRFEKTTTPTRVLSWPEKKLWMLFLSFILTHTLIIQKKNDIQGNILKFVDPCTKLCKRSFQNIRLDSDVKWKKLCSVYCAEQCFMVVPNVNPPSRSWRKSNSNLQLSQRPWSGLFSLMLPDESTIKQRSMFVSHLCTETSELREVWWYRGFSTEKQLVCVEAQYMSTHARQIKR